MSKFTDQLLVESLGSKWILRKPFSFYYQNDSTKIEVEVPEGFITDFASTPRLLYPIFPPIGKYNKAAMVHDFLYNKNCPLKLTRKQCDQFFLQGMEVLEVPKWKRIAMYLAVRLMGAKRFRK